MCAHDFGDQSVSPQQAKFAANPGRVAAGLLFVVGSPGEEDGAEIAIAEAVLVAAILRYVEGDFKSTPEVIASLSKTRSQHPES